MAKFNITFDTKKAIAKFKQDFDKSLDSKAMQKEVGEFLVDRIVKQARSRKPMNKSRTLPNLSDKWKTRRGKLSKVNPTHKTYSKNRSNITFTGELLDSITYKFKKKDGFTFFLKGKHKGYKGLKGKRGKSVKNSEIAKGLAELGYIFMSKIDDKGIERIKKIYIRHLRRILNKKQRP